MGNTEGLPSVCLLCARMLEITGDGWGDGIREKRIPYGSMVMRSASELVGPLRRAL
jgi:hypothetical protein